MKFLTATAIGLAMFTSAGTATAQTAKAPAAAAQAPSVKVSAKAQPALAKLQQVVDANDRANFPAALAAAQAAAQNNDDRWLIGGLQMKAAIAAKDYAGMSAALDAIAASGHLTPAKAAEGYVAVGGEAYNAKDYAGAAVQFNKAIKINPNDPEALKLLGQSLLLGGKPGEAVPVMQRAIQASAAAGTKADEQLYRVAVQAAFDSKSPATLDLASSWLKAYPGPLSWRNTLLIYRSSAALDDPGMLAVRRLMDATGGLTSATEYKAYLEDLVFQSNFNEAHAVLDRAVAAKVIDPASPEAAAVKSKPTASVADLAAAAGNAKSGMAVLKIGDRLYGMGEYAKAADLYRQAKAKGVDPALADLFTGVALARAGDKAGARAALNAAGGARAGIAKYWLLYLDQQP